MSGESTFRVGDAVMVKAGVMCPDKPSLSLAGWQGWVTEVDSESGTIGFTWDSMTLRAIPDNYIRECELEGLGWETMGLDIAEVSLAAPRDTPQEAQAVYEEIMRHHAWDYLADLNPGIGQLLGSLGETDTMTVLNAWKDHLENVLRFPFKARREEAFERSPVAVGKIVEVLGIAQVDDHYGLLANVMLDRRAYTIPLCDLEATDDDSPNYQPLNDYVVWFANR